MARSRKPQKQPPPEFIKELAEGVGRVMIATSQLEHTLGMVIAHMLKLTRLQHRALIIPMSVTNKNSAIRQLGKDHLPSQDRKTLKSILDEAKECADLRNDLAHGFYGAKKGKFALLTFSGDARLSGQPVSWTPAGLRDLLKRVLAANQQAWTIPNLFQKRLKLPKIRQPIVSFVKK